MGLSGRTRTVVRRAATPLLLLALLPAAAGCRARIPGAVDPLLDPSADDAFRSAVALDPAAQASSPPVKAERAEPDLPTSAERPGVLDLTVEDVRISALANNLNLAVARVDPTIARAITDREEARFEAVFALKATGQGANSPAFETIPSSEQVVLNLLPSVKIPLVTGGVVNLGLNDTSTRTDPAGAVPSPLDDALLTLSISQPFLRGAGVDVNTAPIQVARLAGRQSEAATKLVAIRVVAEAERAYWRLFAAELEVGIRYEQYRWAQEQVVQARRLAEGGAVPRVEVSRAESALASRVQAIIVSDTARRRVERELKRIMHRPDLPIEGATPLRVNTAPNPLIFDLVGAELCRRAVAERMEMLELELQLAVDALNVRVAENQTLPAFALDFQYSFRGRGSNLNDALHRLNDGHDGDWAVGFSLEIPLGNRAARAALEEAILRRSRTLASKTARTEQIRQEVLDALDQLREANQRLLAARTETLLAARTWEVEKRQFQAGTRTSTDVLIASDFLGDARSREAQALALQQIALVEIAFATGTTLGFGRVRW